MKKTGAMGATKMLGAGRDGPKIAPTAKTAAAAPKGAGRIGNLGEFAHPPKRKGRGK